MFAQCLTTLPGPDSILPTYMLQAVSLPQLPRQSLSYGVQQFSALAGTQTNQAQDPNPDPHAGVRHCR